MKNYIKPELELIEFVAEPITDTSVIPGEDVEKDDE